MAFFQSEIFWAVCVVLLALVAAVRVTVSSVLQQQYIWNDISRISERQTEIADQISASCEQLVSIECNLEEIRDRLNPPSDDRPMDEADHAHLLASILDEGGSDKTT